MLVKTEDQLGLCFQIRVHIESQQYHSMKKVKKDQPKIKIAINNQIPILAT